LGHVRRGSPGDLLAAQINVRCRECAADDGYRYHESDEIAADRAGKVAWSNPVLLQQPI
jgi:threonine dehydrogenase-like Zn-dependent dehydrogenase